MYECACGEKLKVETIRSENFYLSQYTGALRSTEFEEVIGECPSCGKKYLILPDGMEEI